MRETHATRKSPIPLHMQLWTTADIGAYLKVAPNKVIERFASLPYFPPRIQLPTADGRRTHPRWMAGQVIEWVEGYLSRRRSA